MTEEKKEKTGSESPKFVDYWDKVFLILLTIGGVGWAIYLIYEKTPSTPGEWGDLVGGFGGALAFIWMIYGLAMQREELAMQRKELSAQREQLVISNEESAAQRKVFESQQKAMEAQSKTMQIQSHLQIYAHTIREIQNSYERLNKIHSNAFHPKNLATLLYHDDTLNFIQANADDIKTFNRYAQTIVDQRESYIKFLTTIQRLLIHFMTLKNIEIKSNDTFPCRFVLTHLETLDIFTCVEEIGHIKLLATVFDRDKIISQNFCLLAALSPQIKGHQYNKEELSIHYENIKNSNFIPQRVKNHVASLLG